MVVAYPDWGLEAKAHSLLKGYSLDLILSNEGVPTVLSFELVCDAASGSAVQKMVWP